MKTNLLVSRWASRIGPDYSIYPLWATFYLVGKVGDHPKARDTARIGIESLIDADITVNLLKLMTPGLVRITKEIQFHSLREQSLSVRTFLKIRSLCGSSTM